MKKMRWYLVLSYVVSALLLAQHIAVAEYYNVGGLEIEMDGYVRQEFGYNVNDESPTNMEGLQSAFSTLLVETSAEFGRHWDARIVTRLWADWVYSIRKDNGHFKKFFRGAREEHHFFDDFDDIVREAYITYTSRKFLIRAGRQQVGWGESDGLRLMDVINPLDLRRGGPFYDTQGFSEVRIPLWLFKVEYYPDAIGKITNIALQLIWNPGDMQENYLQQWPKLIDLYKGPFGGATALPNAGGPWAVPTPLGPPVPADVTYDRRTDSIKNSEFGVRLSLEYKTVNMTFNFWHGFAHEPMSRTDQLGFHPDGLLTPMAPVPIALYGTLYYPRVTYAGYTCNFEAPIIGRMLGASTNPVIRIETLYSFDEKMQTDENLLPVDLNPVIESDQVKYMIGFDWNVRWKWINPKKNVFLSGQFFHEHTFDGPKGGVNYIPDNSMYALWLVQRDEYYASLLMATDYLNERLSTNVLYVEHLNTNARWCKATVGYKIGNHWRPSLTYLYIDGGLQQHAFSMWRDRDEVSLQIKYLF